MDVVRLHRILQELRAAHTDYVRLWQRLPQTPLSYGGRQPGYYVSPPPFSEFVAKGVTDTLRVLVTNANTKPTLRRTLTFYPTALSNPGGGLPWTAADPVPWLRDISGGYIHSPYMSAGSLNGGSVSLITFKEKGASGGNDRPLHELSHQTDIIHEIRFRVHHRLTHAWNLTTVTYGAGSGTTPIQCTIPNGRISTSWAWFDIPFPTPLAGQDWDGFLNTLRWEGDQFVLAVSAQSTDTSPSTFTTAVRAEIDAVEMIVDFTTTQ